jgi:hypothetical protein
MVTLGKRKFEMTGHTDETVKQIADAASVVTVVGTLAGVLPAMAALFTIVWTGIRIYETETVQKWLKK